MNNSILSLMPGFTAEAKQLFTILTGTTFVFLFLGLIMAAARAMQERSLQSVQSQLMRMTICMVLLISIGTWGNILAGAVNDIVNELGLSGPSGNVYNAYQKAIAQKFGSDSAGQNAAFNAPAGSGSGAPQAVNGPLQLTHYGYEKEGDPNFDINSSQGKGAFAFDDTPGSLQNINATGVTAAALSPDVVQQYHLSPGQQFTATSGGQTLNLVFADKTADYLTGRIDLYDPNNTFQDSGAAVSSVQGGSIIEGGAGGGTGSFLGGWISKIGDSLTVALLFPLTHMLSLIALGIMWLMQAVQQILFIIEIAISPIFIGMLAVRGLIHTASRFFSSLVALSMWGLGWAVCDLLTNVLIHLAMNPTNNAIATAVSPLTGIGLFLALAIWVIGSSFAAPVIISLLIMSGGGSGISTVFGATVGMMAAKFATGGAQAVAMGSSAPVSAASAAVMGISPRFAKRPTSKQFNGDDWG